MQRFFEVSNGGVCAHHGRRYSRFLERGQLSACVNNNNALAFRFRNSLGLHSTELALSEASLTANCCNASCSSLIIILSLGRRLETDQEKPIKEHHQAFHPPPTLARSCFPRAIVFHVLSLRSYLIIMCCTGKIPVTISPADGITC